MDDTWPRVSNILDVKDWGMKPIPKFILKRYGDYGTSFHQLVHKKVSGKRTRITERFRTKWEGLKVYLDQYEILYSEVPVCWTDDKDPSRRYRGTPDLIVRHKETGSIRLLDIKTGKFYPRHDYQQSAYKLAIKQFFNLDVEDMLLVRPTEEGLVEEQVCLDRTVEFLDLLDIFYDKKRV